MDLLVLCPSRGRPREAHEALQSFRTTALSGKADMVLIVDSDDPKIEQYLERDTIVQVEPTGNMVAALNIGVIDAINFWKPRYVGFVGDDHRFRTPGWDEKVIAALDEMGGGFVYGDDLAQRQNLPTQVFMSASIVRELGWMALPTCKHLYVDNAWLALGEAIDHIKYLPEVVIEHLHPAYGKSEWDEGHIRVNSQDMYTVDGAAFRNWFESGQFTTDVEKAIKAL